MFEQVRDMLAKQLKKDAAKITLETKIKEDLGADSLDIMEMLMNIEEDYGIKIPDEDIVDFTKVGDIVDYLEKNNITA